MNNILIAFILTFIAGFSTLIGTLLIFKKKISKNLVKNSLAFASGVMISVSLFDLIPEGIELLSNEHSQNKTFIFLILSIISGLLISSIIDKIIPENNNTYNQKLYKVGIFSMIAIIIHNIPEGIATFLSSSTNITLGIAITIAIALHNIPEGISIAVPVYEATKSRKKAFLFTFISGMSEPVGALLAFIIISPFITDTIMGIILAIIAGIMAHVSMLKLFPTALKYKEKGKTIIFFIIGFIFMIISHILMN